LTASTEAAKRRAGDRRQSLPGSDGESVSRHRLQKGEGCVVDRRRSFLTFRHSFSATDTRKSPARAAL
jgi:hypothetical protein